MQIFVEAQGATRVVVVEAEDGVEELKGKISEKFGVPSEHQLLRVGGRALKDELTLGDVCLHEGSTVKLGMRLPGGRGGVLHTMDDTYLDGLDLGDREMSDMFGVGSLATIESLGCVPAAAGTEMADPMSLLGADTDAEEMSDMFTFSDFDQEGMASDQEGVAASSSSFHSSAAATTSTAASRPHTEETTEVAESAASTAVASPAEPETPEELTGMPSETEAVERTQGTSADPTASAFRFELAQLTEPKQYKGQKGVAYNLDTVDDKLKKRLIKNRLSAERSRQKKNARLTELEEQVTETVRELNLSRAENVELKTENAALKEENEKLREMLKSLSLDHTMDL